MPFVWLRTRRRIFIGHWTYPAATKKTMYVVASHVAGVDLLLNGKSLGKMTGPAVWRGGVNTYLPKSISNTYLNTECGVNRVFIRAGYQAGPITLTATRQGLESATVKLESKAVTIADGVLR